MKTAQSIIDQTRELAVRAFAKHVITERSEGRWLLQRIHKDGRPESTYATEIVSVRRGTYVGGDIAPVVFSTGYGLGESLSWSYIGEKATIGMSSDKLTVRWEYELAHAELRTYIAERRAEAAEDGSTFEVDEDRLRLALRAYDRHDFLEHASALDHDWEAVGDMGEVLDARVIYAHAAMGRLCELLKAEEAAKGPDLACVACGHDVRAGGSRKLGDGCPRIVMSSEDGDDVYCEGVLVSAEDES